jgi:hypothetical protein
MVNVWNLRDLKEIKAHIQQAGAFIMPRATCSAISLMVLINAQTRYFFSKQLF